MRKFKFGDLLVLLFGVPLVCVYCNTLLYMKNGFLMKSRNEFMKDGIDLSIGRLTIPKTYRFTNILFELIAVAYITKSVTYSTLFIIIIYVLKCILFIALISVLGDMKFTKRLSATDLCLGCSYIVMFVSALSFTFHLYNMVI